MDSIEKTLDETLKDLASESEEATPSQPKRRGRPPKAKPEEIKVEPAEEKEAETKEVQIALFEDATEGDSETPVEAESTQTVEEESEATQPDEVDENQTTLDAWVNPEDSKQVEDADDNALVTSEEELSSTESWNEVPDELEYREYDDKYPLQVRVDYPVTIYRGPNPNTQLAKFKGILTLLKEEGGFVLVEYVKSGYGLTKGYVKTSAIDL